ncbi:hypothetical protein U1Q18_045832 [Sarracenia purpurea var. burkii]
MQQALVFSEELGCCPLLLQLVVDVVFSSSLWLFYTAVGFLEMLGISCFGCFVAVFASVLRFHVLVLLATARVCTASALVLFVEAAFVFFSASCNLSMEAVAAVAIE